MPIVRPFQYLEQDLSVGNLTLEAGVGEGFEIVNLGIDGGAAGSRGIVRIGGRTLLNFPASDGEEGVAPVRYIDTNPNELLSMLRGFDDRVPTLKVPEGTEFVLTNESVAGTGYIFYRELSGGDAPGRDAAGGPESLTQLFVSHGQISWSVAAGATEANFFTTSNNVAELRDFPFEEDVPSNLQYDLIAFATRLGAGSGADVSYDGIRLWYQEQSWLRREEEWSNPSLFPYNQASNREALRKLPQVMNFSPGDELRFEGQASNAGAGAETAELFLTLFFLQRPAGGR